MRNKIVAVIILIIAISLLALGVAQGQQNVINLLYDQMAAIP
jgi:hypothetical protein